MNNLTQKSTLEYFRISSTHGFLNTQRTDRIRKDNPYLQSVIDNLANHIKNHTLESAINIINIHISTDYTELEYYELYTIISMIVSGYIWENGEKLNRTLIPNNLSIPLRVCADYLGLKPFITHASLDLNNWRLIDPMQDFSLDNIETKYTFTNTESESWFYLVMIAIEQAGANLVNKIILAYDYMINTERIFDTKSILKLIHQTLKKITNILARMYEKCDRKHFYQTQRIFLTGSTNNFLFPHGLNFQNADGSADKIIVSGGSAAQSTLIQMLDIILGIKHKNNFLIEMREYMPRWHRQVLIWLESSESIIDIINRSPNKISVFEIYNKCIKALTKFRSKHIAMVNYYVIKNPISDTNPSAIAYEGTGGSNLNELLTEYKEDTQNSQLH